MEREKSRKWYIQRDGSERKQLPRVSKFTIIDTQYANKIPQMIMDFYGVQNKEKKMENIYDAKENFCVNADCFSQHVVDKLLRGIAGENEGSGVFRTTRFKGRRILIT